MLTHCVISIETVPPKLSICKTTYHALFIWEIPCLNQIPVQFTLQGALGNSITVVTDLVVHLVPISIQQHVRSMQTVAPFGCDAIWDLYNNI